jgi:Ca2+-binding RTX toxin-like protein
MPLISGTDNPETLMGTEGDDTIEGRGGDDFLHGNGGNDAIYGNAGADHLYGGAGNDYLVGDDLSATFSDVIDGGAGDDIIVIQGNDEVIEAVGGGYDNVQVAGTAAVLSAGAEVEVFSTTNHSSTAGATLTGNAFRQIIIGTAGRDTLDGGGGGDFLIGLQGNDTYLVVAGDSVVEDAGGGTDLVRVKSGSFTLNAGAQVETMERVDAASTEAVTMTGNEFSQSITGNAGNNVLRGGGGADSLFGGLGNDTYFVDADDFVRELGGQGFDTIRASESYAVNVDQHIEALATDNDAGTAAINLFANTFVQTITGNAGSNYLFGGGGSGVVTIAGLGGDDFIYVKSGDVVVEAAGGGYDNVLTSDTYTLNPGAQVEILSTRNHFGTDGSGRLWGNEFSQTIIGNAGNNWLTGGGGVDWLQGMDGDDLLFVDADDNVIETATGGRDNVLASASYTLNAGAYAEIVSTNNHAGTAAINLTGNELGQIMIGNAGANVLNGGLGADFLQGLGGADSFAFTTALGSGNVDAILDWAANDLIQLDDAVFTGLAPGPLGLNAFVVGSAAQDADDRIIYNNATGALFFDADGNGAGAAVQFATMQGTPSLSASDFMVI